MNHDPAMHAMLSSMWFLMAIPFVFIGVGIFWYRRSVSDQDASPEDPVGSA